MGDNGDRWTVGLDELIRGLFLGDSVILMDKQSSQGAVWYRLVPLLQALPNHQVL